MKMIVGSIAVACVLAPTANAEPTPGFTEWWARTSVHVHELQAAMQDIGIAAGQDNLPGLHDPCVRMHDAAEALAADLPSPIPAVTDALWAAMDDYHRSSYYCDELVHFGFPVDLNLMATYMNEGNQHMQDAVAAAGV